LNADWGCAATRGSILYHSLIYSMVLLTLFCCNLKFVLCSLICRIGYVAGALTAWLISGFLHSMSRLVTTL
jgi:hypothetical protein